MYTDNGLSKHSSADTNAYIKVHELLSKIIHRKNAQTPIWINMFVILSHVITYILQLSHMYVKI